MLNISEKYFCELLITEYLLSQKKLQEFEIQEKKMRKLFSFRNDDSGMT